MNRKLLFVAALLLAVAFSTSLYAGGENRVGTAGATELLIPVGARDIAMGGSTISTTSGIQALFYNPAGLAKGKNPANLYFSHMSYIADIGVDYGAASVTFENLGTLALSVKSLSIGDIPVTTTENPDGTGQTFSPQFFTTGLTYARMLSDRVSVGLTANLVVERIDQVSANGLAFNVGVMYEDFANFKGVSLGVAVKNVGPQMKFDGPGLLTTAGVPDQHRGNNFYKIEGATFEMPSTIEFGLGYKAQLEGDNGLMISSTFQSNNFSADEYRFGAEYSYQDNFFARAGWNLSQNKTDDPASYIYGPTVGAGVHYNTGDLDISVDYAFRHTAYFAGNHIIAIMLGF